MSDESGGVFEAAALVPELLVRDLSQSLDFWIGALGFRIAYERPKEGFAFLDRAGAQIMLEERNSEIRQWVTADLAAPFGRGINFQVTVGDLDSCVEALRARGVALAMDVEEKWYRRGDREVGLRQCLVQDPDGYLVRLSQPLGKRDRQAAP